MACIVSSLAWGAGVRTFTAARPMVGSGYPDDIAFLAGRIRPEVLDRAVELAVRFGVCAHEVLLARGWISQPAYYAALAEEVGAGFYPLLPVAGPAQPFIGRSPAEAARLGLMVIAASGRLQIASAPRGRQVQAFLAILRGRPDAAARMVVTTPQSLLDAVLACGGRELVEAARRGNGCLDPERSAARLPSVGSGAALTTALLVFVLAILAPAGLPMIAGIAATAFLGVVAIRLAAVVLSALPAHGAPASPLPDRLLPVYTLLVPLYREEAVVDGLISALLGLDYPPERLDIKLLVEADDPATQARLRALRLPAHMEIMVLPDGLPKTKPKALNVGLALARGSLVAVYDAEDLPDPDQLRRAAARFAAAPAKLACLQASLTVYNWQESWLSRQFAIEYAGLFDVLLPALARLGLPLPLGGTSNHFRIGPLREVGAWDAYNVTEDADLGLRLARCGYRCGVLAATTREEAPVGLGGWFRQRTRWMKGWMQTYAVHMRGPGRLWRELGTARFLAAQAIFGGVLASVLVHPLAAALLVRYVVAGDIFHPAGAAGLVVGGLCAISLGAGYLAGFALALAGLSKRPAMGSLAVDIAAIPFYWLLMSLAAYRALWQLWRDPHRWEKTEHGITCFAAEPQAGALVTNALGGRHRFQADERKLQPAHSIFLDAHAPPRTGVQTTVARSPEIPVTVSRTLSI